MAQRSARPFSYELPLEQPPVVHTPPPHQPSPGALEQAARLRAAAAAQQQRPADPVTAPPQEEFSNIETPIDDNTQDFDDAPPHVQQAILDARQSSNTPVANDTPPQQQYQLQPQQHHYQQYQHPQEQPGYGYPEQLHQHQAYTEQRPEQHVYPQSHIQHQPQQATHEYQTHTAHQQYAAAVQPTPQQHPAYHAAVAPPQAPLPSKDLPQPPLTPGPVPLKSEEDVKDPRANHEPYHNNPKLHPYSPGSFATPASTYHAAKPLPFSPDTLHNPPLDLSAHQPGQQAHPNMTSRSKSTAWSTSLCSCGPDVSTCMTGIFCPCILYARTNYRLAQKSRKLDPTDMLGHSDGCSGHCLIFSLACGFQGILTTILGARVRHAYNVEGEGTAGEFCKSCCCCCCALVQSEREVKFREKEKQRWAGPSAGGAAAYGRRDDMAYRPLR